jgi:molybdate transport system substrate-binding protein
MPVNYSGDDAMTTTLSRISAIAALFAVQLTFANAADLSVYSTIGVKHQLEALAPKFEKASGHKLNITWGTAAMLTKRVQAGEQADVLILTKPTLETLLKEEKITAGTERHFTSSVMAVAVKKGAPKPDISTPEAFKATLLNAKSIAYPDPAGGGFSGTYFAQLIEKLGIAEQVKAKAKFPADNFSAKLLVSGDAEIAVMQKPELLAVDGIDIVGPYPAALNITTIYSAGVGKSSKNAEAAGALIKYLESPEALEVFKSEGFDPIVPAKAS